MTKVNSPEEFQENSERLLKKTQEYVNKNVYKTEDDVFLEIEDVTTLLTYNFEDLMQEEVLDFYRTNVQKIIKKIFFTFPKIINFENLPEWLKDNHFIKTGYRAPTDSMKHACFSLIQYHNETINIWSHLIGSIMFCGAFTWFITRPSTLVPVNTKFVFAPFFFGAILCMSFSASFHLFFFKSQKLGKFFAKLDYSGIVLLIIGSFIPWIYFAFLCHFHLVIVYNTMISIIGILALIVSLFDKFAESKYRSIRAAVFLTMGLSAVIPTIHLFLIESWEIINEKELIQWNIIMGGLYVFGAIQYALRIPERFYHGKFDYLFNSHQFFHAFVIFAAIIHFHGISIIAVHKMASGSCIEQEIESGMTLWKKWFDAYG